MRISDWSSDVCSSVLVHHPHRDAHGPTITFRTGPRGSFVRTPAQLLDLSALLLGLDPSSLRAPGGTGRATLRRGRRSGLPDQVGEPLAGSVAVAQLGPVLGGGHGEPSVDQPVAEGIEGSPPLRLGQRRRRGDVVLQLDAGVGGRSEEHTSELQSLMRISYAVFCLKTKQTKHITNITLVS